MIDGMKSSLLQSMNSGSGHILISPIAWEAVSGTWGFATEVGSAHYSFLFTTAPAIGDKIRTYAYFASGTYSLCFQTTIFSAYGKFDLKIDGTTVYSGDLYSASAVLNSLLTGTFTIAQEGLKSVEIVVTGKNASATNYYHVQHRLSFQRLS